MTGAYQVQANGATLYTVVDDLTSVYRALITGAVTDEILGEFVAPDFSAVVTRTDLASKTTAQGLFAITGYAQAAFPKLNLMSYSVALTLKASGFRDYALSVPIPQNATFPVAAPGIAMRRQPVRVQGRVVADTAQRLPISGARIISVDPSSPPPNHTIALRSPLYFAHAAGAPVEQLAMLASGSAQLTADAASGSTLLNLSNRAGLAANSILRLAINSGTLVEYATVSSLGPGAGAGQVFLQNALNRSYAASAATIVNFVTAGAVSVSAALTTDADSGDGVFIASQAMTATTAALEPGSPVAEYHEIGALTGSDGYYSLDGIGRTPELLLQASSAGFTAQVVNWFLEYDQAVNVVDFRLS